MCKLPHLHERPEMRQKHYTLLLMWIGTGDDGNAVFSGARV
jgi:hypothetical protein